MPFPVPDLQPKPFSSPPAIIQNSEREDVLWDRPVFTAPPLTLPARTLAPAADDADRGLNASKTR